MATFAWILWPFFSSVLWATVLAIVFARLYPRAPIIFVTAVLDEQIRNQVLEAGAIDILSKQFSDERLASCLVSAMSKEEAPCGGRRGFSKWMHRLGSRYKRVTSRLDGGTTG